MTTKLANSQSKSTAACPKSTVDLGIEKLIWSKNGLPLPLLPGLRPSFPSITTREWKHANRIQTDTGQKMNHPLTVNLGDDAVPGRNTVLRCPVPASNSA
jgi:hypothetical protein